MKTPESVQAVYHAIEDLKKKKIDVRTAQTIVNAANATAKILRLQLDYNLAVNRLPDLPTIDALESGENK